MGKNLFVCIFMHWYLMHATAVPVQRSLAGPSLASWPKEIAEKLDAAITNNAHSGSYACFDADQTTYQWDVEESIIAYLEMKKVLTRENLDPALKLFPYLDTTEHNETLFSYYSRICTVIGDNICYTWAAQVFSGLTLQELKVHVDDMLQSNITNRTIPTILTTSEENSIIQTESKVPIPNFYRAQQELYNRLMANGIEVYVVTASQEELVRMVLSDRKYGYNVKPQNVIGVATLLKNAAQFTSSRKEINENTYDQTRNFNLTFTSHLWSPQAMFAGKLAVILTYISQWKMPILVAGDTPLSDGYMLFHAYNPQRETVRLWVNRRSSYLTLINQMKDQNAKEQRENNLTVTADKNWLYVTPNDLGPTSEIQSNATEYASLTTTTTTTATQQNVTSRNKATSLRYQFVVFWNFLFASIVSKLTS